MDQEECIERVRAEMEMLVSAYPDEIELNRASRSNVVLSAEPLFFPMLFTLRLSISAHVELEVIDGYPCDSNVQIASYRSSPDEKARMDETVSTIRKTASQCLDDGVEGGFACVAAALEAWNDHALIGDELHEAANELTAIDGSAAQRDVSEPLANYAWITGEPLHDRKSTFVAHVCRLHREADVRPALHQLLSSNNKLQKASHNMWAYRILEVVQQPARGPNKSSDTDSADAAAAASSSANMTILKYDNDDDGEDAAGSRLGHLLELRRETSVLVVVSRWFGGISLGPKRFAHINNVARELLVHCHETLWEES